MKGSVVQRNEETLFSYLLCVPLTPPLSSGVLKTSHMSQSSENDIQ